jgi:cephalosporin-C deacetylase-like acetyl esterase
MNPTPTLTIRLPALLGLCLLLLTTSTVPAAEPRGFLNCIDPQVYKAPKVDPEPSKDKGTIKAIFYEALPYKGNPTRVFAYLGVPKSADGKKLPGMVLVHGGGGTAFDEWVRIWNARGYAAIAMDLEGHVPSADPRKHDSHDHAGPSRVGLFGDAELPVRDQWMYHALSDVMLAESLLATTEGVDPDRIGVTGISWGGILSSAISGIDRRFKCAAPVYGCGFLYDSKGNFREINSSNTQLFEKRKFWDPAKYFRDATIPMLWMNGDRDAHFSLDVFSRSSQSTKGPSTLCIHPAMPHGHPPGYNPTAVPEIYVFVDSVLKGTPPLPRIVQQPAGATPVMTYESPSAIRRGDIYFLSEPLAYKPNNELASVWKHADAKVDAEKHTLSATLPADAKAFYMNLTDDRGCVVSSNLVDVK